MSQRARKAALIALFLSLFTSAFPMNIAQHLIIGSLLAIISFAFVMYWEEK